MFGLVIISLAVQLFWCSAAFAIIRMSWSTIGDGCKAEVWLVAFSRGVCTSRSASASQKLCTDGCKPVNLKHNLHRTSAAHPEAFESGVGIVVACHVAIEACCANDRFLSFGQYADVAVYGSSEFVLGCLERSAI